ncbi:hypothetical protein SNE40_000955 [Patella caerulea]|uniref:Uncharacterized protein n=1 Tax=Patella caerulea TaxID=87958 RepID=A0AAN8KHM9_PATCE
MAVDSIDFNLCCNELIFKQKSHLDYITKYPNMKTNQTYFSLRRSVHGTPAKAKDKPSYVLSRGGLGAVTMATPSNKRKSDHSTSSHCRPEGRVSIYEPRYDKTRPSTVNEDQRCALNNAICQNQDTAIPRKCSPRRPTMIRNSERQSGTKRKETETPATPVVSPRSILKKGASFAYRLPITVDGSIASGTKPGSSKTGSRYRLGPSSIPSVPKRAGFLTISDTGVEGTKSQSEKFLQNNNFRYRLPPSSLSPVPKRVGLPTNSDTGMEDSTSESQNNNFRYRLAPSSTPSVPKRVSFLMETDMEDPRSQSETECSPLMMDGNDSSNVEYCKVLKEQVIYSSDFVSRPSRRR